MPDPDTSAVPPLRIHQREALEALACAWGDADHPRAWVVLPPGAGKTRVGLEAVAGELRAHPDTRAVVLAPNTAIQSQWVAEARTMGLDASDDTSLTQRADLPDLPVPGRLRLRGRGRRGLHDPGRRPAPPQRRRPLRADPHADRAWCSSSTSATTCSRCGGGCSPSCSTPPAAPRPGAHRDTAREPHRRPARPRRPALREHPLPRLGPGGGEGGPPRAVRRARLADHPDADRGGLAHRARRCASPS